MAAPVALTVCPPERFQSNEAEEVRVPILLTISSSHDFNFEMFARGSK